ncbi:MAG: DMT family transporter [Hyphomicrobiaceae bacterium]
MSDNAGQPTPGAPRWLATVNPVLLAAIAIGVLTGMDAVIKEASSRYPTLQVAFLRFVFGAAITLAAVLVTRAGWPSFETVRANILRSVLVAATGVLFFYALSVLPLADAIGVSFASPFFVVLFGALILGERIDRRIGLALGLGLLGMLVILGGQIGRSAYSGAAWLGALAAVGSALTYALSMVLLRARAQRDALLFIVLMHSVGPALILAGPAALVWVKPALSDYPLFVAMGLLGFAGHMGLGAAFARAEAARLAPVEYTALVWGTAIGFLVFGELPGVLTVIGTALIVTGTVLNSRRR